MILFEVSNNIFIERNYIDLNHSSVFIAYYRMKLSLQRYTIIAIIFVFPQDAIAHPDRYVLKPNREGGQNNIWGQDIADKLKEFTDSDRAEHILQQKLEPMVVQVKYSIQSNIYRILLKKDLIYFFTKLPSSGGIFYSGGLNIVTRVYF